jgi:hypothetical protein
MQIYFKPEEIELIYSLMREVDNDIARNIMKKIRRENAN